MKHLEMPDVLKAASEISNPAVWLDLHVGCMRKRAAPGGVYRSLLLALEFRKLYHI